MAKGLRFFGTDFANKTFEGTITASSADTLKTFAFDGLKGTRWTSSGENTDGDSVSLEMDFGFNRTIDSFYIYNTNIDNIVIATWNGSSWDDVTVSNATIVKRSDDFFVFAKLTNSVTVDKIRVTGSNTIVANEEKHVSMFLAFLEIGQFEYFPIFKPEVDPSQNVFETTNGLGFIIERGEAFRALLEFKSHVNTNDIALATTLLERKEPFYIWANGGDESIFTFNFKPFRFEDIFKMSIVGINKPEFTKNYYKAGYNNTVKLLEVA